MGISGYICEISGLCFSGARRQPGVTHAHGNPSATGRLLDAIAYRPIDTGGCVDMGKICIYGDIFTPHTD